VGATRIDPVDGGSVKERSLRGVQGVDRPIAWDDELRNALAFSLLAAVYALLTGWVLHLPGADSAAALAWAFGRGYVLAVLVFLGSHAVVWGVLALLSGERRAGWLPLAAPLTSFLACAVALPRLFAPADLAVMVQAAAFLGAGLAFSTTRGFSSGLQQRLLPARRVRDFLARRPAASEWAWRWLDPMLALGRWVPWTIGGVLFVVLPPGLRGAVGYELLVLTFLAHTLNRKLLEELAVWALLRALELGDYQRAGRLPVRAARLAEEIEAAPRDLEAPFAGFLVHGMSRAEGVALPPEAFSRMIRVFLMAYAPEPGGPVTPLPAGAMEPGDSLVRRLLARGVRFEAESGTAAAAEPLPLPRWSELRVAEARRRLSTLYPEEPLWQVVARLYDTPIRGLLLPVSLLWLPLLGLALALAEPGGWLLPLLGAAASFVLLLWLTLCYGNWVFDQSLRRHDFPFLAQQLGAGKLRGELEDALGSRDPVVRERAVELLLFDDNIARLGITAPPAGLRKFLRRAP
jgi:hypothetical protein